MLQIYEKMEVLPRKYVISSMVEMIGDLLGISLWLFKGIYIYIYIYRYIYIYISPATIAYGSNPCTLRFHIEIAGIE